MAKWGNLELEAKNFKKRKVTAKSLKPLTSRKYLAGQALTGLLARSNGYVNMEVLRREAYEWADFMLDDDQFMPSYTLSTVTLQFKKDSSIPN